jgi:hypothetical protein
MNACAWSDCRDPRILDFTPGERGLRYHLERRLGGPQDLSGRRGDGKHFELLPLSRCTDADAGTQQHANSVVATRYPLPLLQRHVGHCSEKWSAVRWEGIHCSVSPHPPCELLQICFLFVENRQLDIPGTTVHVYRSHGRCWPVELCCAVARRKSTSMRSGTVIPDLIAVGTAA